MAKQDEEKLFAFLCYLITIIGVVIVLATKKDRSRFSIYHSKQGLVLFIACIAGSIVSAIFGFIPVLRVIIPTLVWLFLVVLWILGMINSLTGKQKPLPIIGKYAKVFKF